MTSEQVCREFAAQHPTPNVRRAMAAAEAGTVSWLFVESLFTQALQAGIDHVRTTAKEVLS